MSQESNIIQFPLRHALPSQVRCEAANITFPKLFRTTTFCTPSHLQAVGLTESQARKMGIPWEATTERYYTLQERDKPLGESSVEAITALGHDAETPSFLIRHHATKEEALAYLEGSYAALHFQERFSPTEGFSDALSQWAVLNGEHFTLTRVPPCDERGGPTLYYECLVPVSDPRGDALEIWTRAVLPDGRMIDPWP